MRKDPKLRFRWVNIYQERYIRKFLCQNRLCIWWLHAYHQISYLSKAFSCSVLFELYLDINDFDPSSW